MYIYVYIRTCIYISIACKASFRSKEAQALACSSARGAVLHNMGMNTHTLQTHIYSHKYIYTNAQANMCTDIYMCSRHACHTHIPQHTHNSQLAYWYQTLKIEHDWWPLSLVETITLPYTYLQRWSLSFNNSPRRYLWCFWIYTCTCVYMYIHIRLYTCTYIYIFMYRSNDFSLHVAHMSGSLRFEWVCHAYEWVSAMSHIWMSLFVLLMPHNWCHTCEWVGVCLHVTHISAWVLLFAVNELCHTYEWGSTRWCVLGTYQRHNQAAETRWLPHGCVCCSVLQCGAACCSAL